MQEDNFDDLFARQLGRLPAPDFSERDWREVENRLVIRGLQRKLTALTWALPLLGAVSLAMAGGLYHQLRQAHREIEELKKTTAAVRRATAPTPRSGAEVFDTLTRMAAVADPKPDPATADDVRGESAPTPPPAATSAVPTDAPLPSAAQPATTPGVAPNRSAAQPNRVFNQPASASESTVTSSVETSRSGIARTRGGAGAESVAPRLRPGAPERRGSPDQPAALPSGRDVADAGATRRERVAPPNRPADPPRTGTDGTVRAPGSPAGRGFDPPAVLPPVSTSAETTPRTAWGETAVPLKTRAVPPLPLELDPVGYRKPLIAAARRTVPRYAPVEAKGEIRRTGQRAPFRLSGLLDATSVGLHLGLPTGWGNGLPAGRGSVLGGHLGLRLTPRWQVFADVSSQRISPEWEPRRLLQGIPMVRFPDPDIERVGFRVHDLTVLNAGVGVNFVVTDRFALKPYLGVGYNLQVPRRYDVSYTFVKRPHRWPPQFPIDKDERIVPLRDRFGPQTTHQFRLQGGVRYPIQPNLNVSLEGFLNTQFRRLPPLTDTGGLRVGLSYEF